MKRKFEGAIANRYDFVLLFDVENGNPNGDPDAGNMPRIDPETGHGIVTDVCIKRKVRNYVELVKEDKSPYTIFVKEVLNDKLEQAYANCNISKKTTKAEEIQQAQDYMCAHYFDIRTFGAVMSTGDTPCGVVRGPIQINFAQSIDPVDLQEITITRKAVTNIKEKDKGQTMGKKNYIPYGLYRMEGFISAKQAQDVTGFSNEDLNLFWEALTNMFEHDRSSARGKMIVRKLIVFRHESALGNAHSHKLFERITVKKNDLDTAPRGYQDYTVMIDGDNLPNGVTMDEKV